MPSFEALVAQVVGFVEAPRIGLDLPLDVRGTAFQQRVWQALREIPVGETVSYAEIARRIGAPKAVRAVAQACGANTIAVAIPCHRVVQQRRRALRLPLGRRAQARPARQGGPGMNAPRKDASRLDACSTRPRSASASYDWEALAAELDAYGCAVLEKLLTPEECREIAALYPDEGHFRSHILMARHGFGKGEYRYFKYPLPDLLGGLRTALYPRLAGVANEWNERMGIDERYPDEHAAFLEAVPRRRPDAPDAAAAAVRAGRLQLPAPGPLRRSGVPDPGRDPALGAGRGLHRRRVRADRAAAAHAEPRRGGAAAPGRCGRLRRPQSAGAEARRATTASICATASAALRSGMRHTVGIIFHDAK